MSEPDKKIAKIVVNKLKSTENKEKVLKKANKYVELDQKQERLLLTGKQKNTWLKLRIAQRAIINWLLGR